MNKPTVAIIGGGFGGIRTALDLAKTAACDVTLISDNPDFEYYPGLHKVVGISDHAVVSIPLETVFKGTNVNIVIDKAISVDPVLKKIVFASTAISADYVVIAIGSQTEYFNISGLREMSYGLKSVAEARALRSHIEEMFQKHVHADKAESVTALHTVVVGAGPNGTDLAGELAALAKQLARKYAVAESLVTIDLVEGAPRVLPMMPESVSRSVEKRLHSLGVNVLCNRDLRKEQGWTVEFADMKIGAKTLVWTAGITTNELIKGIPGLVLGKKNRAAVDDYLQAKANAAPDPFQNVFVIGDAADTKFSGLAQTALNDARFVSKNIIGMIRGRRPEKYVPQSIAYNIGVGPRWSVMVIGKFVMTGLLAYIMRTLIDIRFFLSILPAGEVWKLYVPKKK